MIVSERLQIVWIVREFGDGPVVQNGFSFAHYSLKPIVVQSLLLKHGTQNPPHNADNPLPDSTMM